jgi:nucleoside-diphosphate-sugar epimerase
MTPRVLLTGANGFLGSHILDRLRAAGFPVRLLLRPACDTQFIRAHLPEVEVCRGSVTDSPSLAPALEGITHVIHCAGKTKALRVKEYYEVNQQGARRLVEAVNARAGAVRRLVVISSLAASRPALPETPAREDDPPAPVSEYGRSKLAAEQEVRAHCRAPYSILRPAAVYGPRDRDVLVSIQWLRAPLRPRFGDERQALSFIFAPDAAEATLRCLLGEAAAGRTYNVASPEVLTLAEVVREITRQLGRSSLAVPLPAQGLWLVCLARELLSRLTRRPHILSRQKYPELRAPGWVCDPARLRQELGFTAPTPFRAGLEQTIAWYREVKWL